MGMAAQITRYKPNYRKTSDSVKVHLDTIDYCNIFNSSVYITRTHFNAANMQDIQAVLYM